MSADCKEGKKKGRGDEGQGAEELRKVRVQARRRGDRTKSRFGVPTARRERGREEKKDNVARK